MAKIKPGLGIASNNPDFIEKLVICMEIIMGRRGGKIQSIGTLTATNISGAPAADDYNKLVADQHTLVAKINEILTQLQD